MNNDIKLCQKRIEYLETLVNILPGVISLKDHAGRWLEASQNKINFFGLENVDFKNKTDIELAEILPHKKEMFLNCYKTDLLTWEKKEKVVFEERINNENNQELIWEVSKIPIFHKDGGRYCIISYALNVTENKKVYDNLEKKARENKALLEAIPDTIFTISTEGVLLSSNLASEQLRVVEDGDLKGKHLSDVLSKEYAQIFLGCLERVLMLGNVQTFEYALSLSQDNEDINYFEARMVRYDEKEVLVIVRDITERKKMYERLKYLSLYDALTQLYNRAYFEQEMQRLSMGRNLPVTVIVCDVDGLKMINDIFGHAAGDKALCQVAELLKKCTRAEDMVARIGGDEFAILLAENESSLGEKIYERINAKERYLEIDELFLPLSLSVGIAVMTTKDKPLREVFKEADTNMYKDKMQKRNFFRKKTIQILIDSLREKDFDQDGHTERLKESMLKMTDLLGIDERMKQQYLLLVIYHDLGKAVLPKNLLFKKEALTNEDWLKIKQHCEFGHRIAQVLPELKVVADWILKHHEWWNGKGYPNGIKGFDIPQPCRIFSIIEAYDIMLQERPYRKKYSKKEALKELKEKAGIQFDPDLVKLFEQCIK